MSQTFITFPGNKMQQNMILFSSMLVDGANLPVQQIFIHELNVQISPVYLVHIPCRQYWSCRCEHPKALKALRGHLNQVRSHQTRLWNVPFRSKDTMRKRTLWWNQWMVFTCMITSTQQKHAQTRWEFHMDILTKPLTLHGCGVQSNELGDFIPPLTSKAFGSIIINICFHQPLPCRSRFQNEGVGTKKCHSNKFLRRSNSCKVDFMKSG